MTDALLDWFLSLGEDYGVNPWVFGGIYVGAIPFFLANMAWLVRRLRAGKAVSLQIFLAGLLAMSSYIYLVVAGRNLAWWVYAAIAGLALYGLWSALRRIRTEAAAIDTSKEEAE